MGQLGGSFALQCKAVLFTLQCNPGTPVSIRKAFLCRRWFLIPGCGTRTLEYIAAHALR